MSTYTGRLLDKRKDELFAIVDDLDLRGGLPAGRAVTKYDLQEAIRAELKANRSVREDPRFEGIWAHMPESKKPSSLLRTAEKTHDGHDLVTLGGDLHPSYDSPRKSLDQLYHENTASPEAAAATVDGSTEVLTTLHDAILQGPKHIVDSLMHRGVDGVVDDLALVPVSNSLRRRASKSLALVARRGSTSLRHAAHETVGLVEEAQVKASQPWVVVGGILAAELAFIVYEAVPWVDKHYGPHEWLHRSSTPSFTLHLPVLSVLFHRTFFAALLLWVVGTYLLPLALATIFSFPTHADRRIRRHGRASGHPLAHLAPPNPLIFSLSRLALALLRGYVLAPPIASPTSVVESLKTALKEIAAGGPGSLGLAGGRYSFDGAVTGLWGVVAVGMGVASVVSSFAESRV
ncbi:uncharacterized protein RHOBADRAFT_47231 [Rhodotorula graminis WP1]|uniref:Uncharacterized protein n=1 Tax=Rhodotorula graminis (strain WP1) TaxID=578459 RepID=A0A0P9EF92_RHOGW|nr:uncharacterized protein RHOBADRAFT_47231 [Rhodotorula graminis WP1]KPV72047.1 hypothetical protein RHOBADRAFT_47231 [Rhodotorula graminis WP1]